MRSIGQIFPSANEGTPAPGLADDGTVPFQINFTDGTSGLFTARVPGSAVPGDVNGDGAVDVDDLIAVILAWGQWPSALRVPLISTATARWMWMI